MSTKKKIAKATIIILIFSIVGKMLGFVREMIIAAKFGTTTSTDAYFLGLIGPESIRDIISGGVLAAVFIPVYSKLIARSSLEDARKFVGTIAVLIFVALLAAVVIGIPLAPYIIKIIAPEVDRMTMLMAADVSRIVFPAIIFMGFASFLGSLLNVNKRFIAPALNQTMLNAGIICGVLFLGYRYGIRSIALGFLFGAILQFIVIISALRSNSIGFSIGFEWSDEIKKMFKLWFLFLMVSLAAMANELVSRSLAAGLEAGNISAIIFSNRIRETVWLLCAVPIATAVFPYLSENAAFEEKEELSKIFLFALRLTVFMALPICLIMSFYSTQIVQLLFERGVFDENSTKITAHALYYFSFGTLFYALNFVVLKVYYSLNSPIKLLKIFIVGFVINIILGLILRKHLNVGGIALARSLSDIFTFGYLLISLKYLLNELNLKKVFSNIMVIGAISFTSVLISYLIFNKLPIENGSVNMFIKLSISWVIAGMVYISLCSLFKIDEIKSITKIIRKKMAI